MNFWNLVKNKSLNCEKYLEIHFLKNIVFIFLYVMGQRCLFSFHFPTLPRPAWPFHAIKFQFHRQNSGISRHPGKKIDLKPLAQGLFGIFSSPSSG